MSSCGEDGASESEIQSEFETCIEDPNDGLVVGGCGNIFAFKFLNEEKNTSITVEVDPGKVLVTNQCTDYQIPLEGIEITLNKAKGHPDSLYFNYCNDIVFGNEALPHQFDCESGIMTIVSKIDTVDEINNAERISIQLSSLTFLVNDHDTIINSVTLHQVLQGRLN